MEMVKVTLAGKVVSGTKEELKETRGLEVASLEEAQALLLLVENSPRHEDGDFLRVRERLRYHGGYRRKEGYRESPLEVARRLLRQDLLAARLPAPGAREGLAADPGPLAREGLA